MKRFTINLEIEMTDDQVENMRRWTGINDTELLPEEVENWIIDDLIAGTQLTKFIDIVDSRLCQDS